MKMPVRKVTYRLYPSRSQSAALSAALRLHQQLYNAALEQRIDAYRRRRVSLTYADQCHDLTALRQECPEFATLNCSSQQVTLRRLDKAFKAFFERVKTKGAAAGFPRFKSLARFPGFGFKSHGDGWRFTPGAEWRHGKLRLQGVGTIKARGQARQGGIIKASELLHRDGAWHLSLTLECPDITRASGTEVVAFDWGTETFATLAVGEEDAPTMETVENPRWYRHEQQRITDLQQAVSRKRRGSNRRRKAVRRLATARARTARRRLDWQHKLSSDLVKRSALIATEHLSIAAMTRSAAGTVEAPGKRVAQKAGLNREILDTAPSQFLSLVRYKVQETGTALLIEAPTRRLKPSQTCPCCGTVRKKALSERAHTCDVCGTTLPRDFASAWVVLRYAHGVLKANGSERPDAE
ncbi:transposase [Azospirillum sp. B21]|nr:transposase [Azospirillum sp. B21]